MKFLILALLPAVAGGQLPGGITPTIVDPNSEPVVFAVKAASNYLNSLGGPPRNYSLVEIVDARVQTGAVETFYLTLHLTEDYFCNVKVLYRPWVKGSKRLVIISPACKKRPPFIAGGISTVKPVPQTATTQDEITLLQILKYLACEYNSRCNCGFAHVMRNTTGVTYTTQVTGGVTYRFYNVVMQPTYCRNRSCLLNGDLTKCIVDVNSVKTSCTFSVLNQPWRVPSINPGNVAFSCVT